MLSERTIPVPSRYSIHVENWSDCRACELHLGRRNVVLARGALPCDVLFVGEAPGKSEDTVGAPFVGPAGQLLDTIVAGALGSLGLCPLCRGVLEGGASGVFCPHRHEVADAADAVRVRVAFTNLIACIPLDPAGGDKLTEPPAEAVKACSPRLREFVSLAFPRLLVQVGKQARDWLAPRFKHSIPLPPGIARCEIQHPSYLLRLNSIQRDLGAARARVVVRNAFCDAPLRNAVENFPFTP